MNLRTTSGGSPRPGTSHTQNGPALNSHTRTGHRAQAGGAPENGSPKGRRGKGRRGKAAPARRRRLPLRYLLPSLLLVALLAMLMLRGYVHSEILADHRVRPPAPTAHVPEKILEGGPVIDTRGGRETTLSVPDHRLVLTFDDGPDPEWTPKVLDVLKEHDAHGVFFVTGTMASRYPGLVRRMVDEGHEVGLHTFNHPDLSYQSESRIDRELSQNQLALAGPGRAP
ncbi:hypothetical protein SALBM135S_06990 [Streptomyces alboniger]